MILSLLAKKYILLHRILKRQKEDCINDRFVSAS